MTILKWFQQQLLEHFSIMAFFRNDGSDECGKTSRAFNKVWHFKKRRWKMLCQWGQWHIQQGWSRKRRMIVIILQPVSLFFLPSPFVLVISENRTWSAAWREVNQEPGGLLLTSFICLSSSTFLHSLSVSFALSHPSLITAHQCSWCIWKIYLRFSPLYEKVWKPKITLGRLSAILLWESY